MVAHATWKATAQYLRLGGRAVAPGGVCIRPTGSYRATALAALASGRFRVYRPPYRPRLGISTRLGRGGPSWITMRAAAESERPTSSGEEGGSAKGKAAGASASGVAANRAKPWLEAQIARIPPPLDPTKYKGQAGKVGVVGGCTEYTGAPFFAAMSAVRVGADLAHVFCTEGAGPVIKTFSPELIVHPYLREEAEASDATWSGTAEAAAEAVSRWFSRLDVLVVGPGLGRDPLVLKSVAEIIRLAREAGLPIVVDADGLFVVNQNLQLVQGYTNCVLTPNVNELARLPPLLPTLPADFSSRTRQDQIALIAAALGGVTVVAKGAVDVVSDGAVTHNVDEPAGSLRRCGGQGDVLAGTLAVFVAWSLGGTASGRLQFGPEAASAPLPLGATAACKVMRTACEATFRKHRRAMVAGDIIPELGPVMDSLFPVADGGGPSTAPRL